MYTSPFFKVYKAFTAKQRVPIGERPFCDLITHLLKLSTILGELCEHETIFNHGQIYAVLG